MTAIDVCEAIAGRIAVLWPERILYRDFCPADHKRPSGYLYITEVGFTDLNAGLVQWRAEMELELFCATDAYDISSTEELRQDQDRVLRAFPSTLAVGDRVIPLSAKGDGMEQGSAYVKFSASWVEPRPVDPFSGGTGGGGNPGSPRQEPPMMEHFEVNTKEPDRHRR